MLERRPREYIGIVVNERLAIHLDQCDEAAIRLVRSDPRRDRCCEPVPELVVKFELTRVVRRSPAIRIDRKANVLAQLVADGLEIPGVDLARAIMGGLQQYGPVKVLHGRHRLASSVPEVDWP
jgi:hypothetical protein